MQALIERGFSPGLVAGFFKMSAGARWTREFARCRNEGDVQDLATDIVRDLLPIAEFRSIRGHDFQCPTHGYFEEMFSYNTYDEDACAAARATRHPCSRCVAEAAAANDAQRIAELLRGCPQVTIRAPGISSPWSVKFGGHTYDADAFDARVDAMSSPKKDPRFYQRPDFQERFLARFEETAVKTMAGELPSPPPLSPDRAADVAAAITKGVS